MFDKKKEENMDFSIQFKHILYINYRVTYTILEKMLLRRIDVSFNVRSFSYSLHDNEPEIKENGDKRTTYESHNKIKVPH